MTTTLHINGAADVLALLPYRFGFHPEDSLVVVAFQGTTLGMTARVDLPSPEEIAPTVEVVLGPLLDQEPEWVILVGYERTIGDSLGAMEAMESACEDADVEVRDRVVVRDGRWWSLECRNPRCCPPQGQPLSTPDQVPAVAEFVGREITPVADRAALGAQLGPDRPLVARAVECAGAQWLERLEDPQAGPPRWRRDRGAELAIWARVLDVGDGAVPVGDLPPADLARAVVGLIDVVLRDALIAWLCPGAMGGVDVEIAADLAAALPPPPSDDSRWGAIRSSRVQARLIELCRSLSPQWAVAPLTVLACFTWWEGDGALTRLALERALEVEPDYRLAVLLMQMVDHAIRPQRASA